MRRPSVDRPLPHRAYGGVSRGRPGEAGFTLTELLVVLIVIGILAGVAIPSYLQNQGRAREAAAQANIRAAIPSIELYFTDNQTYVGISYATLKANYDGGLSPITFESASATTYCVEAMMQSRTFSKNGPAAPIVAGGC